MTAPLPLVDAEARRAIREDLDATLVVEAAAGTGKTTEMIARIIGVIRTGRTTLERIVAVTFTEKAAGEMKLRLRTELERTRKAAEHVVERDRLEAALAELEVARVGSIHSFCADLLRERPIEAKIDPLFEVAAEDAAAHIYQQAFDTWFQSALAAPGEGVRRILRRTDPTQLLRDAGWSLIDKRDFTGAWRRDPFEREAGIDAVLEAFGTLMDLPARAFRSTTLVELLGRLARWMDELARRESVRGGRDYDGLEAELAELSRWKGWTHKGGTGKQYGDGLTRVEVVDRRDTVRATLEAFLQAAEADLAACLREELRPLVAAYEHLKDRAGRLDFLDLLVRTRDLLATDRAVRAELQQRFTHFFVDEFQDTDPLQVEILLLLAADDRGFVTPGKLFVVGDPKQAIYRFRRADVAVYEAIKQRLLTNGGPEHHARLVELVTSFRAVPAIQAAVNAAFAPVMAGEGQARYVALERHRDELPGQPALVALPVPDPYGAWGSVTNEAIEDSYPDAVAAFIDQAVHQRKWTVTTREGQVPLAPQHVCLMFKRFQSYGYDLTRDYVRALEARGIPHVLVGGRSFHEREEVEAIRNALAAIEWPDDELAVYATLRGPCFSLHDEDLLAFREAAGRLHPLQWIGKLVPPLLPEVAGALRILGMLHVERNRRPIADTLSRLLAETRAHAGFAFWPAGEQALANVMRVVDFARRFEAGGATSFRAFVDKVNADAERGRQPDAPVVEERTEGVRIMTVHTAKGLEFPAVILCDPTAPLAHKTPSRHHDAARRVWLEPLAKCVPVELRERSEEILQRDREEGMRLAYVAATRARDLLVVPVVGDEVRDASWLQALIPVIHPDDKQRRRHAPAPGCPSFGDDSVRRRPNKVQRTSEGAVRPGLHVPRAGSHRVVWWDPNTLDLDRILESGMRQRQLLQLDEGGQLAATSTREHDEWQAARSAALASGAKQSLLVWSITHAATVTDAATAVTLEDTRIPRAERPRGKRFGSLVHAALAAIDLRGDAAHVASICESQGRLVGAPPEEIAAARTAVVAALQHPLLVRAAAAGDRGALKREVPVVLATDVELLEGIVDLAFEEDGAWTVVDYKTDAELDGARPIYEAQVTLYARAIATATGKPAHATLLIV